MRDDRPGAQRWRRAAAGSRRSCPRIAIAVAPVWAGAVERGEACELEYRVSSPARGTRWFAARVIPIRDVHGRLVRWFGTTTDLEPFKRHEARLAFLDEASQLLASSLDHEATLARVCALAVPRLADWCAIDLVDEQGVLSRLALVHRDPAKLAIAERARRKLAPDPNEPGSTYAQLRSKQSTLIPAIDDRYLAARLVDPEVLELTRGLGLRSAMVVPLVSRGTALGVLSFVSAESGRQFGPEDLKLAEELAQRAAFAVDSANLYRSAQLEIAQRQRTEARLREETALVEALNRVGKALGAELELDRLVQTLTDEATALTGAQFGAFFYNVQNARGESYMLYTLSGVDRSHFEKFPMPRNTAVFGPTFRGEGVVRIHDVTADPRYGHNAPHHGMPKGHLPVRSYLAAPVSSHSGEVLGGLFFGHAEPGRFDERAERALVGISAQASIAVENARLYQRAQEAVRLRDEFLSVASHELRTPVTSLKLVSHSLSRSLKEGNLAAVETQAGKIHRQLERAARMVDALLDVSRISSGKVHVELERLELAALVREVCARFADELSRSGSTLHLELAEPARGRVGPATARAGRHEPARERGEVRRGQADRPLAPPGRPERAPRGDRPGDRDLLRAPPADLRAVRARPPRQAVRRLRDRPVRGEELHRGDGGAGEGAQRSRPGGDLRGRASPSGRLRPCRVVARAEG